MRVLFGVLLAGGLSAQPVAAHEFWIEPLHYVIQPGEVVKADLRVGQDFGGSRYPFLSRRFKSFTMTTGGGISDVPGTEGDTPAVQMQADKGLLVMAYDSQPDSLRFRTFEKFENYVTYEGLDWAIKAHRDAGLPEAGFKELYSRNAKALVQVGPVGGADRAMGLPFEIVVDGTPYADGLTQVPVTLYWQGSPVADWPINVFTRAPGQKGVKSQVRTNADGRATVPFDGQVDILLNAVWLVLTPDNPDADWESWWASTSFGRVGRGE